MAAMKPLASNILLEKLKKQVNDDAVQTREDNVGSDTLCHGSGTPWHKQKPPSLGISEHGEGIPDKRCLPVRNASVSTLKEQEEADFDEKCKRLSELIRSAKHLVAFTGAGISTSVGLPDYRGENGIRKKRRKTTKASNKTKTTAGKVAPARSKDSVNNGSDSPTSPFSMTQETSAESPPPAPTPNAASGIPDFNSLVPSQTHMALYELHRLGFLKYVVSQNVDNLHLKSGLPPQVLMEVHGNATQAKCETCEKIYTTGFPWTGLCDDPKCPSTKRSVEQRLRARTRHGNGRLKRNVISFDEPLGDIDDAIDQAEEMDVALVLGTSLKVEPFAEMASEYAKHLIMVNLQATTCKLDKLAQQTGVRLYERCDVVMRKVMKHLLGPDYEIPRWQGEHPSCVFTPEHEDENLVNVLAGRLLSSS